MANVAAKRGGEEFFHTDMTTEKKAKTNEEVRDANLLFHISIPSSISFRALVENISHVIKQVDLQLIKNEEFEGLRIDTLDDLNVCLVLAQLPCEIYMSEKWIQQNVNKTICLSVEMLLLTLRQVESQYCVSIEQFLGSEDMVVLKSSESITGQDTLRHEIRSIESQNSPVKLKSFPVEWQIEMELATLRSFLRMCETIKADDVEIILKAEKAETSSTAQNSNDSSDADAAPTAHKVTMKAFGEQMNVDRTFVNTCLTECEPKDGEEVVVYNESFSTKFISNFIRSMNRATVIFHMAKNNPLHVSYLLGARGAKVTFILAARRPTTE